MDPPIVDCRSLIEFCRAFEKHRSSTPSPSRNPRRPKSSLNPLSHPFCSDHSPFAAIDAAVLLLVAASLSFLTFPYLSKALLLLRLLSHLLHHAPFFYASAFLISSLLALFLYELLSHYSRKCGSPFCKGLKKAVEFDIQLESEECVKYLPPVPQVLGVRPLELGEDHKELEAELKKMAPPNGRTVLIFRAPCGCPAGRMEVWGPKKVRRIKK